MLAGYGRQQVDTSKLLDRDCISQKEYDAERGDAFPPVSRE